MKRLPLLAALSSALCLPASADFQIGWEETIPGVTGLACPLGDVDGDGDADAILIHLLDPGTVLLNNGNGRFDPSPTAAPLPTAGSAELGDLDGDGDLDLFLAVHLGPCQVWLNDGDGNFSNSGQAIGGTESRTGVALADLDGDNDLDVVLPVNDPTFDSEVWKNNGAGVFTHSGQSLGNQFAISVSVGDLDGDSDKDIVFANNGTNTIWLNNGSASFTLSPHTVGSDTTFDIGLADLDGDSDLDAIVVNGINPPFTMPNQVWKNNGSGVFTNTGQSLGTDYSLAVVLEDADGDGDKDAVVGTNNTMPNRLYLNNGSGTFTQQPLVLGIGAAFDVRAADLDGDGDKDYFFGVNGGPSEVWRRVPAGQGFLNNTNQKLGSVQASCVARGDFDGDGDDDIALGSVGGIIRILRNNGTGQFQDTDVALVNGYGNNNSALAAGDLDGDSDLDLFAVQDPQGSSADLADRVWFNNGDGTFTLGPQLLGAQNGGCVVLVDLDADGDLDAVVGNAPYGLDNGQNKIHYNNGSGTFTTVDALGLGNTRALAVANFDGSPGLDIFVGDLSGPSGVWKNNGSGTFTHSGQAVGSGGTYRVLLHDFDLDGDLDAFCANVSGGSRLYWNNGTATFTDSGQNFGGLAARDAALLDADGDGDLDIWSGNGFTADEPDQTWINNGTGTFALGSNYGNRRTYGIAAADFNADGDTDVFAASGDGDHVLWSQSNAPAGVVEAYAASFGLTGGDTDPLADPDEDGVQNFAEMAYNMNPDLADATVIGTLATATKGLPKIRVQISGATRTFIAETIRRKNQPLLDYRLQVAAGLSFSGEVVASESFTNLNADYERATYQFVVPGNPATQFGRFGVFYNP